MKIFKAIGSFFKKMFTKDEPIKVPSKPSVPEVKPDPKPIEVPQGKPGEIADFKFVDSSHHHAAFEPEKYKAPILSNKCTQGTSFVDSTHSKRKNLCAQHGIKYSGYHFFECNKDPIAQVEHYMKTHGNFILPPQVDYETTTGQTESDLLKGKENLYIMLCELEKRTGMTPWIYVNYGAAGRLKFDAKFGRFPAWFARYNSFLGPIPAPWTEATTGAWQFTESDPFPGFPGKNDVNIYYGKANVLNLE